MHQRSDSSVDGGPLEALASASACLSELVGADALWRLGDQQVVAGVDAAYRLVTQAHTAALVMLGELDRRGLAVEAGAPSTQQWLAASQRMRPQEAKRDVTLARLIRDAGTAPDGAGPDGEPVEGSAVRAGLVAGDLNVDQAGCVATALAELPTDASVSTRVLAERLLVDEAALHGPAALTRLGHRILERIDPDAADRRLAENLAREEREARRLRSATRFSDGHGSVFYKFRIPIGDDAIGWPVLDALSAPEPAETTGQDGASGGLDTRSPQQRLADAFVEVFRRVSLDAVCPPPVATATDTDHHRPGAVPGGWAGGDTSLDNGVLLGGFHHRLYDTGTWTIKFAPGGIPESIPPSWIDRERRPRRHERFLERRGAPG